MRLAELFEKWRTNNATPEEREEFLRLLEEQGTSTLDAPMKAHWLQTGISPQPQIDGERLANRILQQYPAEQQIKPIHKWRWVAAAAVVVCMATTAAFLLNRPSKTTDITTENILPGKNGAILTLADGSQVVLDSLQNGVVASQNGSDVLLQNGNLTYNNTGKAATHAAFNSVRTPRGRQFSLTLPDGSKVWLNAASSLRFPTAFTGKERLVEVTGEAFFEIAKKADQPFRVSIGNNTAVEVLGTQFNVNAYEDEQNSYTTLLEGSVRVNGTIIQPGQLAQVNTFTAAVQVKRDADIEKIVAWKNGLFNFEGASVEEVMKQVARWYDLDIVYEKGIPEITFVGKITRSLPLKDLLEILERAELRFRLEQGRKLIILQ